LVALALIAVIVAAGAGYWLLTPKIPNELTTTVQQTSLLTPLERSQASTESTILASPTAVASTSTVATAETLWINVTASEPLNYYLSLLESNGTQPYVQLATELRKLPDLTNATAVGMITYLSLNATNPEVKEAFQLMMKGGTPSPSDFQYSVPSYNTELQVLYWLACQNEFKRDDTLALAIAMVNGLWVTMGNEQVRQAVYNDTTQLLRFFRETNDLQESRGYFRLEDYPLEAKVALAWTGGLSMQWQGPLGQPKIPLRLEYYQSLRIPIVVYEKDTVSINTLRHMREIAETNGWWSKDANNDIANMEEYLLPGGPHWVFATFPELILDDSGLDASMDANWQFNRYLDGLWPKGDCGTQTVLVNAWSKSIGIATLPHWMYRLGQSADSSSWRSHSYTIYFDPTRLLWTAYSQQIITLGPIGTANETWLIRYFIFRPPVDQRGYLQYEINWSGNVPDEYYANLAFRLKAIPFGQSVSMMKKGINAAQMKQWLLYS
jgi:hypothetical protein